MVQDSTDPRKKGVTGLKGVNVDTLTPEEQKILDSRKALIRAYRGTPALSNEDISVPGTYTGTYMENYGSSQYDEPTTVLPTPKDIQENRYNNQSSLDVFANGAAKMLGTAGTTFLSSLFGLPYGLFKVATGNSASSLWDNELTQKLSDVDKWMEDNLTNYKSQAQEDSPTWRLGDMNWWADNVIKNFGFTIGAAGSMAVGAGSLGLLGKISKTVNSISKGSKFMNSFVSSLFSATGEGMIEAKQGVEERNNLEMTKLKDEFAPEMAALEQEVRLVDAEYNANKGKSLVMGADGAAYDPAFLTYREKMAALEKRKQDIKEKLDLGEQQITESGKQMGNKILLANQALLTAGNMIQFSNWINKGFDNARHAAEVTSKYKRPFGVRASRKSANLKDGYDIYGKTVGLGTAFTKNAITEGSEEMNQQWIQSASGAAYNERDVNDYWKLKKDPKSYREATEGLYTVGRALSKGFEESWGSGDQWEQFLIGAMTGLSGTYMPTKIFNQDKSKAWYNPGRYGEWAGGAYKDYQEFKNDYDKYEENINDLNRILAAEDFPERVQSFVGHTYTEKEKEKEALAGNKKLWKDYDDKQSIMDMQAFLRAGKLDDLRTLYKEAGRDLEDSDIESIIRNTTRKVSSTEDKQMYDAEIDKQIKKNNDRISALREELDSYDDTEEATEALKEINEQIAEIQAENTKLEEDKSAYQGKDKYIGVFVDEDRNQVKTNDEIRKILKDNANSLNRKLDSYLESSEYVNKITGGQLTKDQEDNLVYLHNLGKEKLRRAGDILKTRREELPQKFLFKTDKTPEQLAKENASSDLAFYKDENTKDGYVEVDSSLLDDDTFNNFFVRDVILGGNINSDFAETAEEKDIRKREEEKDALYPEEERKRRAKERSIKKGKKYLRMLQDMELDAEEQRSANVEMLIDNFKNKYKKDHPTSSEMEVISALNDFIEDIADAVNLTSEAGDFNATLAKYLNNPSLVDKSRDKEEKKIDNASIAKNLTDKFSDKTAKDINQDIKEGIIDEDTVDTFADLDLDELDLDGVEDPQKTKDTLKNSQKAAKTNQDKRKKQASLKSHIQENTGGSLAGKLAMQMVDNAAVEAETPEDISLNSQQLSQLPLDAAVNENIPADSIDAIKEEVGGILAQAFNNYEEDKAASIDIPDTVPEDETPSTDIEEVGNDPVVKTKAATAIPFVDNVGNNKKEVIPENPLTEGSIDTIIHETAALYDRPSGVNGLWRSCTTEHPYGKSTGTYHEILLLRLGKDSIEYKRSKAIWEYLRDQQAFARQSDVSDNRIKEGNTIHLMVRYFKDIYNKEYNELTDKEKPYALAIIMLNERGEVIGDLPLAQLEKNSQIKELLLLQDKVFKAFDDYKKNSAQNQVIVDDYHLEGIDNLSLTFNNNVSMQAVVKQVMRGAVPYRKGEINTLNDVAQSSKFEIAVKVSNKGVAVGRKNKEGEEEINDKIKVPSVGKIGQPYLLLPTPSGEKIAVPFYMNTFDTSKHVNTDLYKALENALYSLIESKKMGKEESIAYFKKNVDVLEGLLQVKRIDNIPVVQYDKDGKSIVLHLRSLTDPNKTFEVKAPKDAGSADIAKTFVEGLNNIPINVSLQYINKDLKVGLNTEKTYNYNRLIGEIASVNLPKDTHHTVNGWFTIELNAAPGKKQAKWIQPRIVGRFTENIGGRTVELDADRGTAIDVNTGEIITNDNNIDLRLAQIRAQQPINKDKEVIKVSINDKVRTYNVKENRFIDTPKEGTQTITSPQSALYVDGDDIFDTGDVLDVEPLPVSPKTVDKKEEKEASHPEKKEERDSKVKTIEEIEKEFTQETVEENSEIITDNNKDAWSKIPDNLKIKMINEGIPLQVSFGRESFIISVEDKNNIKEVLTKANRAAKMGALKVTEAPKPMIKDSIAVEKENERKARQWLSKNLPTLNSEERVQFVNKLIRGGKDAGKIWGSYRAGVIEIRRNAPIGTIYHEAFHYVLDMILDAKERRAILNAAKREYGNGLNDYAAEERLANDFRRYAIDENDKSIVGSIKRWLRKIWDKIRRYDRISDVAVNQLFRKINNGEFAQRAVIAEKFEDKQQRVLREIRNVQKDKYSWDNLNSSTKEAMIEAGLTKEAYQKLSLEEKEQYVRCRG